MRVLTPEILDHLAPADPRAVKSRHDLACINRVMRQGVLMARLLADFPAPKLIADLGGGDGRFMLSVAKRLADRWRGVSVMIADRQPLIRDETRAQFARLGWHCEGLTGDVFATLPGIRPDIITANLFLHHLNDGALARLLALVAGQAQGFAACEPRRSAFALLGAKLVGVLGANDVTRHDAVASVRAGFHGQEISALWPRQEGWALREQGHLPFTHGFAAHAV
jgi:hypothetical protein